MKKILVIILSAMMILTFMPSMAFAGVVNAQDSNAWDTAEVKLESESYEYTGKQITPKVVSVTNNGNTITSGFTVTYGDNINCQTDSTTEGTVTVTYDDETTLTKTVNFDITPKALNKSMFSIAPHDVSAYNALSDKTITVTTDLTEDTDYSVELPIELTLGASNIAKFTGVGNYTGTVDVTFSGAYFLNDDDENTTNDKYKIVPRYTTEEKFVLPEVTYNGNAQSINFASYFKVLYEKTTTNASGTTTTTWEEFPSANYDIKYTSNTEPGTAKVEVIGKGYYVGTISRDAFKILKRDISKCSFTNYESQIKNQPKVTVTDGTKVLAEGIDYILSDNGAGTVTVQGNGHYDGIKTLPVTYGEASINAYDVTALKRTLEYTGYAQKLDITVKGQNLNYPNDYNQKITLREGYDYKVVYENNINVGSARAKVIGIGKYAGTVEIPFTITAKAFKTEDVTLAYDKVVYDGKTKQPAVYVTVDGRTLVKDKDFKVTYGTNTAIGKGTVTVSGITGGNYTGYITKTFQIYGAGMEKVTVQLSQYTYTYNGQAHKPTVTCYDGTKKLTASDYTVAYKNNTYCGTATVEITGKGNYAGTKTVDFTIVGQEAPIKTTYTKYVRYYPTSEPFNLNATCAADETGFKYTSLNPEVATVSATGVVTIKDSGVAKIKVETVGTKAYNPVSKTCTVTVKPLKPTFTLSSPEKGKLKALVTKEVGATKYEVRFGKSGSYKIKSITHKNTTFTKTSYTASKLQSGKTYFVKVRAVKVMADGTTVYGNWSATKKIRVK